MAVAYCTIQYLEPNTKSKGVVIHPLVADVTIYTVACSLKVKHASDWLGKDQTIDCKMNPTEHALYDFYSLDIQRLKVF